MICNKLVAIALLNVIVTLDASVEHVSTLVVLGMTEWLIADDVDMLKF